MPSAVVTIRIPDDLLKRLRKDSAAKGVTLTEFLLAPHRPAAPAPDAPAFPPRAKPGALLKKTKGKP